MGVFDEVKRAGSAAGGALTRGKAKVGELSRVEVEKRNLRSLEQDLAVAQQEMGALVFDLVGSGELRHPALGDPQAKINETLALIAEKKAEIAAAKAGA
jgi:hypothetical protein